MLTDPTLDKLLTLKCTGMIAALADQMTTADIHKMSFEECLGLLVNREAAEQENRRLTSRLRRARLRHNAALEDIDLRSPRGLDRELIQSLAACQWVKEHLNVLIAGPTGVGKTWLACALAHKACREGHTALYCRLARTDFLVLDDWGLAKPNAENRRDLLEVLDERHGRRATIAASQLPTDQWHTAIGDPTLADAILDRLIHKENDNPH